jgi:hypothetical protein
MDALPAHGLANTLTGFATFLLRRARARLPPARDAQPARWRFAYWTLVVTGVFAAFSWIVVALFWARRSQLPARAKPLLALVVAIFLAGFQLATASNE